MAARDLALMLRFERDRASSLPSAVQAWVAGATSRLARWTRLRHGQGTRLLRTELLCADEGLLLNEPGSGVVAPWHLHDRLLHASPATLPAHPLIDWVGWLQSDTGREPPVAAVDALLALLVNPHLRWKGLPQVSGTTHTVASRMAVCLHLYYPEVWPEMRDELQTLPKPLDVFITIPRFAATPALAQIVSDLPGVRFFPERNRGRDVLPWLRLLDQGVFDPYDWVCKLHTKRSPHVADGAGWRQRLVQGLFGQRDARSNLLQRLNSLHGEGIAGPPDALIESNDRRFVGACGPALRRTRARLGWAPSPVVAPYFAGTMFWFRPKALRPLSVLARDPDFFPVEARQTDGTPAHAVERLVGECAARMGYGVSTIA